MVEWSTVLLFAAASLPLIVAPGPSVAYVLTTTLSSGRRAGLCGVAGVETGYVVHVVAAVAGVSAVVAASARAFAVVKLAGALYLVWLAFRAWRSRNEATLAELTGPGHALAGRAAFTKGLMIGALNPKTAVFFVAFLPQFVHPDRGPAWAQMTALGLLFIAMATVPDSCWAVAGGGLRRVLPNLRMKVMDRVSGTVYLGLAAYALTARRATD